MKHSRSLRAFTLIELLVVIAIIGLLASIVMASLSSARAKALLAAGQESDASTYHNIGDSILADWEMNEGSGTVVNDSSGNVNTMTYPPGTWTTNTPSGRGSALSFNGTSGAWTGVIPNLPASTVTVSAWVNISTFASWANLVSHNWVGNGWILLMDGNGNADFGVGQSNSQYNAPTSSGLSKNVWHFLVGTYDGSTVRLYVDGALAATTLLSNASLDTTGGITIGGGSTYGYMDEVRIYTRAFDIGMVKALYAEGLARHEVASRRGAAARSDL